MVKSTNSRFEDNLQIRKKILEGFLMLKEFICYIIDRQKKKVFYALKIFVLKLKK